MPRPFFFLVFLSFPTYVSIIFSLVGISTRGASAVPMLYNDSLPMTLSNACSAALMSDTACNQVVRDFSTGYYYSPQALQNACTPACKSSLDSYWNTVQSACGSETIPGPHDRNESALFIPGTLKDLFAYHCVQDAGRFCSNVAALAAVIADPGSSHSNYLEAPPDGAVAPSPCDMCFLKRLALQAGSPYFNGPELASESVYQSFTSSCNIAGQPLTTTTLGYPTTEAPLPTPPPCMGTIYPIQPGDTCYSISRAKKIGTGWLLSDNNLESNCHNFPQSGNLCISNTCDTYTIKTGDTCASIAQNAGITIPQLQAWNPIINAGCYNLKRLSGSEICISSPGKKFVNPGTSNLPGATITSPAPVPSDAVMGSNRNCGRWYKVQLGDYCNLVVFRFGISMQNFIFLNPAINSNCTNLYADESYYVQAVGDINTYSGMPGYVSTPTIPIPTSVATPFSNRPDATAVPYERLYTKYPLATGTRDDCAEYFNGDQYQYDVNGTSWKSNCEVVVKYYEVDPESFGVWNAGLANVNDPGCLFKKGFRYCGSYYKPKWRSTSEATSTATTASTPTSTKPSPTAPTMTGQPTNCNRWHTVASGDTCSSVAQQYGLTQAQFLAWNPTVDTSCSQNFWLGNAYCVGIESNSTPTMTTTSSATSTKPSPTAPTMTGQPSNCNRWHTVASGDNCDAIAQQYGITRAQFLAWNPTVSSDCSQNFWLGNAYCVGVDGRPPAQYIQAGAAANCVKWDRAVSGDYCAALAQRNGISLAQLGQWNTALGTNGANCSSQFWLDYYYCVGV